MAFRVWGCPYETSDAVDNNVFQPIKMNSNIILKAFRVWVIFYDNPSFTNLRMKIYSDRTTPLAHNPGKLIATSTNSFTKNEISTYANAVREIYFEFPDINLQGETWYNLVLNMDDYAPVGDEHMAWRNAFPDPVYATNLVIASSELNAFPFTVYAIGAEF